MAPPAKKRRKNDHHAATLLDFFTKQRPTSKSKAEVIVLDDSDSDSVVEIPAEKRRGSCSAAGSFTKGVSRSVFPEDTSSYSIPLQTRSDSQLFGPFQGVSQPDNAKSSIIHQPNHGAGNIIQYDQLWRDDDDGGDAVSDEETADLDSLGEIEVKSVSCHLCGVSGGKLSASTSHTYVEHLCEDFEYKHSPTRPSTSGHSTLHVVTAQTTHSNLAPQANAFSLLMSGRKENDAWKAAEMEQSKFNSTLSKTRQKGDRRQAPFYKILQGMPIAVDAFRYGKIPGVTAYFLTHAHSDHYTNLSSSWKHGPIYCSKTTANLISLMLDVNSQWINPLPFDTPTVIPNSGGVEVTLIEANHCPGSALFVFHGRQTVNAGDTDYPSPYAGSAKIFRYLHCGDFRASPRIALHPSIKDKKIDLCYLDTTYLDPRYSFPPQKQVIEACSGLAKSLVKEELSHAERTFTSESLDQRSTTSKGGGHNILTGSVIEGVVQEDSLDVKDHHNRTLICVGTYSIGKERIVKAIANALSSKIYCDARKSSILDCQEDDELRLLMTKDPYDAQVHVVPLQVINSEKLEDYFSKFRNGFTRAVGFRPTGWTFKPPPGAEVVQNLSTAISRHQSREYNSNSLSLMRNSSPKFQLYGVPYSEHSSFIELTCFALSIDVVKMVATVNVGNATSRGKMGKWFERWMTERRKRLEVSDASIVPFRDLDYW